MRVLLTVSIWGAQYCETFLRYSLPSLLSKNNIPSVANRFEITCQIITSISDIHFLKKSVEIEFLSTLCEIEWLLIEDLKPEITKIPTGHEGLKYNFLSSLQNVAIQESHKYDLLVFNYADFIWTDGSLLRALEKMDNDTEALLGFCVPVDAQDGKLALENHRIDGAKASCPTIDLSAVDAVELIIKNMHREAKLRYWDGPAFSVTPTYLIWPVDDSSALIRAFHQTIIVMRPQPDEPEFVSGITTGSLDATFSDFVARRNRFKVAEQSDEVLIFSLYDTIVDSRIQPKHGSEICWLGMPNTALREGQVVESLEQIVTPNQAKLAQKAFCLKGNNFSDASWSEVSYRSQQILSKLCEKAIFDEEEHRFLTGGSYTNLNKEKKILEIKQVLSAFYTNIVKSYLRPHARLLFFLFGETRIRAFKEFLDNILSRQHSGLTRRKRNVHANNSLVSVDRRISFKNMLRFRKTKQKELVEIIRAYETDLFKYGSFRSIETKLTTSLKKLEQLVVDDANWIEAHRAVARCLWFQGNFDGALQKFSRTEIKRVELLTKKFANLNDRVVLPINTVAVLGLIGHIDAFIKQKILSNDDREYLLLIPEGVPVANAAFISYWEKYLTVVRCQESIEELGPEMELLETNWHWGIQFKDRGFLHVHNAIALTQRKWADENRKPLLSLRSRDRHLLRRVLTRWGMEEDEWFVCLHVRSAGYYSELSANGAQDFRNTPIEDYYEAVRFILDEGGWVIRMGDNSMPKLELEYFGENAFRVIDYAHSPLKSAELDVALCASCKLFVSSPSGLYTIAKAFGTPVCYVNFPLWAGLPWYPDEVFLPKSYLSTKHQAYLSLEEIYKNQFYYLDQQFLFDKHNIRLVKNTPIEIREAVRECFEKSNYKYFNTQKSINVGKKMRHLNSEHNLFSSGKIASHYATVNGDYLLGKKSEKIYTSKKTKKHLALEKAASKPKLDILVPTFNRPAIVHRMLLSFMKLDLMGVRVVVIDDCSDLSEPVFDGRMMSTKQVCESFNSDRILYLRRDKNAGVAEAWAFYYKKICDVKYTMSITDKDVFIRSDAILEAISLLDNDETLGMVIMPLRQEDREYSDRLLSFSWRGKMPGKIYLEKYLSDPNDAIRHCSMWGVIRVAAINRANLPRNLNLRKQGLDDGFGIDIDFVFNIAIDNYIAFIPNAHVRRSTLAGGTEKLPVSFAYTYLQYAKRAMKDLERKNIIDRPLANQYISDWLKLVCKGLVVSYNPAHGTEAEIGSERLKKHLPLPMWLYIPVEILKNRINPDDELLGLYSKYLIEGVKNKLKA